MKHSQIWPVRHVILKPGSLNDYSKRHYQPGMDYLSYSLPLIDKQVNPAFDNYIAVVIYLLHGQFWQLDRSFQSLRITDLHESIHYISNLSIFFQPYSTFDQLRPVISTVQSSYQNAMTAYQAGAVQHNDPSKYFWLSSTMLRLVNLNNTMQRHFC